MQLRGRKWVAFESDTWGFDTWGWKGPKNLCVDPDSHPETRPELAKLHNRVLISEKTFLEHTLRRLVPALPRKKLGRIMLPNFNHPTPRCWEHSAKRTSTAISPYCCVVFQMRSATLDSGTMCCKNPRCSQSNLDLFSHLREHLDKIDGPGFNHWVPN